MQSFIGASKLLYHVSKDDIIPGLGVFKTTYYSEPIPAMILIFTLIQTIILIGSFDGAARVNSMFYLACFACINISTALLSFMQYPNWRPKFHFNHWALSLTGFIVCIVFMFLIDWVFAILVLFALGLL